MLRTLFVLGIAGFGSIQALRGPFWALLLYLWVAYFRPEQWVWGGVAASLNLSFIVGVFLVISSIVRGTRFTLDLRAILLFAFLGQSLISTTLSPHADYCWPFLQEFAKTAMIAFLMPCLVTNAQRFKLTIAVISASLGFEMVKQGWAQLLLTPGTKNFNSHPALGDENGVALGVLMLVPLMAVLAQTSSRKWQKWGVGVATVGAVYRAISTYSRGGFVSSGALLLMVFAKSTHKIRTALAVIVVAGIILPVLPDAFWSRMKTIAFAEEQLDEEDASSRGRLHYWRVAVLMAGDRPLTGVGHNGFSASYDRYDFLNGAYGTGRAVHSSWFGVLAELGYPGAVLLVMNLLLAFTACRSVQRKAAAGLATEELGHYASAVETALVVFVVGGSFLSFQYMEIVWHLIALSAALQRISIRAVSNEAVPQEHPAEITNAFGLSVAPPPTTP
jgi:probable O-glycosylation ligase (exosortase A-associated)